MRIAKQGEIKFNAGTSALRVHSEPTELNKGENAERPFKGDIIVQPHSVPLLWRALEGRIEKFVIKSGDARLFVRNQREKKRVRFVFSSERDSSHSSYVIPYNLLGKLRQELMEAVNKLGVISISHGDFSAIRTGNTVVLRNGKREIYLDDEGKRTLASFIYYNYLMGEPIQMKNKNFEIKETLDLAYKGLVIPRDLTRELYMLILGGKV